MTKRTSTEGAATVEAVVFLPVLILLFFAVTYASNIYATAMRAEESARLCVNLYADQGCSDAVPLNKACGGVAPTEGAPPPRSEGDDALDTARADENVEDIEGRLGMLSDVLDAIFGAGHIATISADAPGAPNVGLQARRIRAVNYALCNSQPVNENNMAIILYEAFRDNPPKADTDD